MARSRAPGPLKIAISDVPSSSNFSTTPIAGVLAIPEQLGAEIVGGRAATHSVFLQVRSPSEPLGYATIQRGASWTLTAARPEFPSVLGSRCGGFLRF